MAKIQQLNINNFQRVEVAKIAPSNHLIVFAGKNAMGKSSSLNAIEANICGHSTRNNPRPIREGATKGDITTVLDNGLTVVRRYSASGTTLTVKSEDGGKYGQAKLSGLIGSLGMDVSQFTNLGEKEQLETLLKVVPLPFDLPELDGKIKTTRDERTAVNRRTKELEAQALQYAGYAPDLPPVELSVNALIQQQQTGYELKQKHQIAEAAVRDWAAEADLLRSRLAHAEAQHAAALELQTQLADVPDLDQIQQQIEKAEEINKEVRRKAEGQKIKANAEASKAEGDKLTAQIEALEASKTEGLAAAVMPVEGLTFDTDGLLYKGIPFSRASDAEKILVSVAMMIALKPELRSLIVRNGNNLDDAHLEQLRAMAETHDFQIFIEIVAEHGEFEYTFHDGNLAA